MSFLCLPAFLAAIATPILLLAPVPAHAAEAQPGAASASFPAEGLDEASVSEAGGTGKMYCRLGDGSFLAVDLETAGEPDVLVVRRFNAAQLPVGEPVRQEWEAVDRIDALACNPQGDFVLAWVDWESGAERMRIFSSRGTALSPVMYAAADADDEFAARHNEFVAVAISPARVVVLETEEWLEDYATVATVMTQDGTRLGTHVVFAPGNLAFTGALRVDRAGNALVARDTRLRVLTEVDSGGRLLGEPFAVPGVDGQDAAVLAVADGPAGGFIVLHPGVHEDRVGTLVSLDGRHLQEPSVASPEMDPEFTRSSLAMGPRPDSADSGAYGTIRPRPWPPAPRLAKGADAWVMARVEPERWSRAWNEEEPASWFAVLQRSGDGGRSWGPVVHAWEPSRFDAELAGIPDVAGDERGHLVAASIADAHVDVLDDDDFVRRYPHVQVTVTASEDDAGHWSPPRSIFDRGREGVDSIGGAGPVRVATDGHGTWLVVWGWSWDPVDKTSGSQMFFSRSTDDAASWSEPGVLAEGLGYGAHGLDLAWDGRSRWVAAWSDGSIRSAVSEDGLHWSEPSTITEASTLRAELHYGSRFPLRRDDVSLATNGKGRVLLVASSEAVGPNRFGVDGDVFAWRLGAGRSRWSTPRAIASWAAADGARDHAPKASADLRGGWIVAWRSAPGGSLGLDGDVLVSRSGNGRSWGKVTTAPVPSGDDGALDHPGDLVVAEDKALLSWVSVGEALSAGVLLAGDTCGDGTLEAGERCDDANTADGDGCNRNCSDPACGNGALDPDEQCDDGNDTSDDFCTTSCTVGRCGDGFLQALAEACDDGNDDTSDSCPEDCVSARCGDGFVEAGVEECDEGQHPTDGCVNCRLARCGDGEIREDVEECDDNNSASDDWCTNECRIARCGDGHLNATGDAHAELCEPGVGALGDHCTADCRPASCPDVDGDGNVRLQDALAILQGAVTGAATCPRALCDANSNGRVDLGDARLVLRRAVGIGTDGICAFDDPSIPGTAVVTFLLGDSRELTDLRVNASYGMDQDLFDPFGTGTPACESLVAGAFVEFHSSGGRVEATLVAVGGVTGPAELFRCSWYGGSVPYPGQFVVSVDEATDGEGQSLDPLPHVSVTVK